MTPVQTNALITQIISIVGGLLVGLGVTSDTTWQTIAGALIGIVALFWAFKSHTATTSQFTATLSQALQFVGAFLVTKGAIDSAKLNVIMGAVVSAITLVLTQLHVLTVAATAPTAKS